mgnify:FL=1|jgi:hypothetical protein
MTATAQPDRELLGCDFSSSPSTRKNIVLASGRLCGQRVQLLNTERFSTLDSWQQRLSQGPWLGGFDLPFGLPRELVDTLGWPTDWLACVQHFAAQSRADLRQQFKAFCDARPAGQKFAHRATDRPAGSSPSMKWVNPPVAWMMHAGVPRLLAVGAWLPAHQPDPGRTASGAGRVALEAYPGLLARELLGGSTSYKSDDPARQTPERQQARRHMLDALAAGHTRLDLQLELTPAQAEALVADASGDALDAVLCLVQVAWAGQRGAYGLPAHVDPLEGWITSA